MRDLNPSTRDSNQLVIAGVRADPEPDYFTGMRLDAHCPIVNPNADRPNRSRRMYLFEVQTRVKGVLNELFVRFIRERPDLPWKTLIAGPERFCRSRSQSFDTSRISVRPSKYSARA